MNHHEKMARQEAIVSIGIALSMTMKLQHNWYARKSRRGTHDRVIDRLEQNALDAMAREAAGRVASFALIDGETIHHWQAAIPVVRETLQRVPMDVRAMLASRSGRDVASEIAADILRAVDSRFTLAPLPGRPGAPSRHSTWQDVFQATYPTLPDQPARPTLSAGGGDDNSGATI